MRCRSSVARHAGALELGRDLGLVDAARRLARERARERLLDGGVDGARLHGHAEVVRPRAQLGVVRERLERARAQRDPVVGARLGIARAHRDAWRCSSSSAAADDRDVGAVDDRHARCSAPCSPSCAASRRSRRAARPATSAQTTPAVARSIIPWWSSAPLPSSRQPCSSSSAAPCRPRSARSSRSSSGRSVNHLLATLCFFWVRRVPADRLLERGVERLLRRRDSIGSGLDHVPAVGALDRLRDLTGRRC